MIRTAAFGAAVAGLFLALPAQAQQQQQQQQPLRESPAATQEQVDQPAPDLEHLQEEDLNRTKAAQRLPNGGQTAALPSPDALGEWESRLAENPQVLERDAPVREAWNTVQESHAALEQAEGATRQEAQQAYEESLELLERAWTEATD